MTNKERWVIVKRAYEGNYNEYDASLSSGLHIDNVRNYYETRMDMANRFVISDHGYYRKLRNQHAKSYH